MTNEEFIISVSLEGEEWRDVVGYEGFYMVSSLGRIVSLGRVYVHDRHVTRINCKILKPTISIRGKRYQFHEVKLFANSKGKTFGIARIVANSFLPKQEGRNCIDHIDTDTKKTYTFHNAYVRTNIYNELND